MAGGGSKKTRHDSCYAFLTEDIVIEILLRLSSGSSIGRFRCVCRSWRNLLSDPDFVRRILAFKNPNDEKTLRVLITGSRRRAFRSSCEFHYSSWSYETLRPISGSSRQDKPSILRHIDASDSKIIGCCDGIFCILHGTPFGRSEIVLWNPATSETKTLPPCSDRNPYRNRKNPLTTDYKFTGFGFDPRTKDYKVIRVLRFRTDPEPARIGYGIGAIHVPAEVYSLRNDSWKNLRVRRDDVFRGYVGKSFHVNQQRDTSRNENCYWIRHDSSAPSYDLISFDMTREEFALTHVPRPHGRENWHAISCFVSKGVFMATFMSGNGKGNGPCELWGLLKCGVAEPWTKLLNVRTPGEGFGRCLEVSKDGMYICSDQSNGAGRIFSFDPATGEIVHDHLEIEGTSYLSFDAHTYLPTQVSLDLAADRSNC